MTLLQLDIAACPESEKASIRKTVHHQWYLGLFLDVDLE